MAEIAGMTDSAAIGTLMLIDDNEIDQMLFGRMIERSGYVGKLITFLSAEEALDYLRSHKLPAADAILLDINMPRMDGFEFLEAATNELGESFARLVVVMLTTSLDPKDKARAKQFSVVKDYLNKPLTLQYLQNIAAILQNNN